MSAPVPEPIADDELLYRRVPQSQAWYDPEVGSLSAEAFHPNKKRDVEGISLWRARFKTAAEAAAGQPGKRYYIAVLRAGDLRARGIDGVADEQPGDPNRDAGHAVIPALNARDRRSDACAQIKHWLARELTLRVEGPFETPSQL